MLKKDKNRILTPDLGNLHAEIRDQPKRVRFWMEKEADARLELDQAEDVIELVEAEMDHKIRRQPERYGIEKTTEPQIKAAVIRSRQYQEAKKTRNKAKHKLGVIHAMVTSLEHKKPGLQDLVKLDARGYWADPDLNMDEEGREAITRTRRIKTRKRITLD